MSQSSGLRKRIARYSIDVRPGNPRVLTDYSVKFLRRMLASAENLSNPKAKKTALFQIRLAIFGKRNLRRFAA